jgi:hypothetical protein
MPENLDQLAAPAPEYVEIAAVRKCGALHFRICGGADYVAAVTLEPLCSTKSPGSPPNNV